MPTSYLAYRLMIACDFTGCLFAHTFGLPDEAGFTLESLLPD
jgi:hypothetical protein